MATKTFAIPSARRAAWMTARARNAARRGGLVASVGLLAVTATLLLLVLLPREVNRSVRARVDALPEPADTTMLLANVTGALDRLRNAEANLQSLRVAYADRVASATANPSAANVSAPETASGQIAEPSEARKELMLRVARARSAPLVENFRAVGDADFLRNDAAVRVLLDSLNEVHRDREAYAALGGPDARYAAMTARLTTLGQRLLLMAEQRLTFHQGRTATASAPPADSTAVVGNDSLPQRMDTTMLAQGVPFAGDSTLDRAARAIIDSAKVKLLTAEQLLMAARETNASITRERQRAVAGAPARVPPFAMLLASLVLGLALGYGVAFYRELQSPRIADAAEVERVIDTRVIVHTGPSQSARQLRHRRESDDASAPVVDTASESYQLLHVTLTGFGDTSREVQVFSNDATLGATVGVNLAVAAARDSRSTLLVDTSAPHSTVARLLHHTTPPLRRATGSDGSSEASTSGSMLSTLRAQLVRARVGRNLTVDTVSLTSSEAAEALRELENAYDFTVIVHGDAPPSPDIAPHADVILCVRVGVTRLDWITTKAAEVRDRHQRLRAVLLWAARAPAHA